MSTLSEEVTKALYALQVAIANQGGKLELIRIATTEHAENDFVQFTQVGPVTVELVP